MLRNQATSLSHGISYRTGTKLSRTFYLTHLYFCHKNVGEMWGREAILPSLIHFYLDNDWVG
jgi:hypothetical protein